MSEKRAQFLEPVPKLLRSKISEEPGKEQAKPELALRRRFSAIIPQKGLIHMTDVEKMETLKTFANFPPETKYGFAAGYAAAKAEAASEKADKETTKEEKSPA